MLGNVLFGQTLLTPANGAIGVAQDVLVTWNAPTPPTGENIEHYQVQASIGDLNFWWVAVDVDVAKNELSYQFSSLELYTGYYWRLHR